MPERITKQRSTVRLTMTTNVVDLQDLLLIVSFTAEDYYSHHPQHGEVMQKLEAVRAIVKDWEDDDA